MRNPYAAVLRTPGAPGFVTAGLLARLPLSMYGIGLVLLVESTTGSYGAGGGVVAAFAIASAVGGPVLSRLVDRHGQRRVALPALAVHVAATAGVLLAAASSSGPGGADTHTTLVLIGAAAALAGASFVGWGSLVRARWAWALRDPATSPPLHPAFSLESVLDEVVFTVGPPLVTLLAVGVSPSLALAAALASTVVGGAALLAQRGTEPPVRTGHDGHDGPPAARGWVRSALGVIEHGGVRVLVATFVFTGVVFGAVDVTAIAFTEERGQPAAAGLVLALYAVGSLVAGVVFGAVTWRGSLPRRFVVGVIAMAVLIAPLALATSTPLLAAALFLAGLAISPTLISGNALVAQLVPPRQLTEGLAWVGTALGIGVAVGAAVAGRVVDGAGPQAALLVPVTAAATGAVVVLACSRALGTGRQT